MSDDRERVAEELRRVREGVRDRALLEPRTAGEMLGAERPTRLSPPPEPLLPEAAAASTARPDNAELNQLWRLPAAEAGLKGRFLQRTAGAALDAQRAFNARQVQFDNEILVYIDARLAETHRHYDRVLGQMSRHLAEADERHLILQEELVAHVHDLVRRIDLVLGEAEKGRLGLEFALRDLRTRLQQLEGRIKGA